MIFVVIFYCNCFPWLCIEGGPQDVTIPKKEREAVVEAEEITTLFDAKVKVYPSGHIKVIKDGETEETKKRPKRQKQQQKMKKKKSKGVKPPQAKKLRKK